MHTYVKPTGKDNACKGRRVVRLASKVTTGREQKEEEKKKTRSSIRIRDTSERKKKKGIPKRRVTVTGWLVGPRSKRVVSEFQKLHRNLPELRCNRVKSFETRNKIAARCDVTLNRGGRREVVAAVD